MDYKKLVSDAIKLKPGAQKQLYEHFAPVMLGVCFRYTKSVNDAEDILQEGFIKVFKCLHQYKSEGEIGAWIRKLMVNTALNYLKKNRKYQHELAFEDMPLHPVAGDDPQVVLEAKELTELIRQLPTGFQTSGGNLPNNSAPVLAKIKSSFAFVTGIFLEKNIARRKFINAGLNYKMFSTVSEMQNNDSTTVGRSEISARNYRNYYHFFELPLSLKVQVNSGRIKFFWDAGVSISQLISSNALQLNNTSFIYYKNNSLFKKTHLGFNTALSASLFSSRFASLLVGPNIYFGTTKIAKEGIYKNQHFAFVGLRSQLLFKK